MIRIATFILIALALNSCVNSRKDKLETEKMTLENSKLKMENQMLREELSYYKSMLNLDPSNMYKHTSVWFIPEKHQLKEGEDFNAIVFLSLDIFPDDYESYLVLADSISNNNIIGIYDTIFCKNGAGIVKRKDVKKGMHEINGLYFIKNENYIDSMPFSGGYMVN